MLNVHSNATSDPQVAPDFEELEEKSKIPFNFLHLPFCLIDEDIIASLDGPTVKVLTVITRYVNLTEKIRVGKRVLLSGWGIPISYEHIAKKAGVSRRTAIRKVKLQIPLLKIQTRSLMGRKVRTPLSQSTNSRRYIRTGKHTNRTPKPSTAKCLPKNSSLPPASISRNSPRRLALPRTGAIG